jgi:hypothetical protein
VTFFFDNHHAPALVKQLKEQRVSAVHLREEFPASTDDEVWIPQVAERGWIVLTGDLRIRTHKKVKLAFRQARLITFFMQAGYTTKHSHVQVRWVLSHWTQIEQHASTAQPGDCFIVPEERKVVKMEWARGRD